LGKLAQAVSGRLIDAASLGEHESAAFTHSHGLLNRRQLLADPFRGRPEAKQRGEPIELIAEGSSHQNMSAVRYHSKQFSRRRLVIANVMPHMRHPGEATAPVSNGQRFCRTSHIRQTLRACVTRRRGEHGD
jgi:hypothetical protein